MLQITFIQLKFVSHSRLIVHYQFFYNVPNQRASQHNKLPLIFNLWPLIA